MYLKVSEPHNLRILYLGNTKTYHLSLLHSQTLITVHLIMTQRNMFFEEPIHRGLPWLCSFLIKDIGMDTILSDLKQSFFLIGIFFKNC